MRGIAPILASVVVALGLAIGLLALERQLPEGGASLGAAVALAAIAAFLLSYDLLKREELGAGHPDRPGATARSGKATVRPMFDSDEVTVLNAFVRDGARKLSQMLPTTDKTRLVVFQIVVSRDINYESDTLLDQINIIKERTSPESWVYFVGPERRFLYCAQVTTIVKHANAERGFFNLVRAEQPEALGAYADLFSFTVGHKATSADALERMAGEKARIAMIVHERYKTPIGPIDWATLTTRVLRSKS